MTTDESALPEIVVVGPCASGKSTLVRGLRAFGYAARVCAQEHSEVPKLWLHQGRPYLIALTAQLESVRLRRDPRWPAAIHSAQVRRLTDASANADVVINTDGRSSTQVLEAALQAVGGRETASSASGPRLGDP